MTEVRQQDSATQTLRRLDRALREIIVPAEVRAVAPLRVLSRPIGGEPVSFAVGTVGEFDILEPGSLWGRAWDTAWMHVTGAVPNEWSVGGDSRIGTELELVVDLGFTSAQSGFQAEGLVYTSHGEVVRALSPLNHRVALNLAGGDAVDFWVEAAANPTLNTPDGTGLLSLSRLGSWDSAGDELIYCFGGAALTLRDTEISGLRHDAELLRGIAASATAEPRRRRLILSALDGMLDTLDPGNPAATATAARAILAPALSSPAHASAITITAVGHAHIDSAWLWPLRETIRKCARTFSNVVTLMEQNPDFVFACSSAQQFQWMKDYYPDLFDRIRERVATGQFVPVGGMWVESDTNMPSGESLARQFIVGQGFFQREFGILCEEVWLPDSFGYTGAFPQIARSAGARWFFGQKLSWNRTNRMPHHTFEWEGIDGTRILTHFTPVDTYNSDLSPAELIYASENFEDHESFSGGLVPFGYGDGGGGPTREMLEAGRRAADAEGLPRVEFASPATFFREAQAEADAGSPAIWRGEMYLELHRGTYTSQSRTKRGNRRAESLLRQAELWAATASVRVGMPYPAAQLNRIWERTLLLQFHDILPGSSISWVHADAERMHAEDAAELRSLIDQSLAALTADEQSTALSANGSPFARAGVSAFGFLPAASDQNPDVARRDGDSIILRNDLVELRVSPDGGFVSLLEVATGHDLFTAEHPGNVFDLHHDIPTDWDAWDIDAHYRRAVIEVPAAEEVGLERDQEGPFVRIRRAFGSSSAVQEVRLVPGEAAVDIVTTVQWHEQQKLVKLAFPFAVDAPTSTAETQFGFVTRPTHENTSWDEARFEVVAHRWLHVSDGRVGVAVVNDSTYGHDVTRIAVGRHPRVGYATRVRQTLLRGPRYPDPESDQGQHTFRSRVVVSASRADAVRAAYDLDTPMLELSGPAEGIRPIVEADGEGVVVSTVKLAEDGSGDIIVRLHESLGRPTTCRIALDAERVWPVDLLERDIEGSSGVGRDGEWQSPLRAFEVLTLRGRRAHRPSA